MNKSNEQRHKERQERAKLAVKLYKKGQKIPQIAKEVKVSDGTVENYLLGAGIVLNKTPKKIKQQPKLKVQPKAKKTRRNCPSRDQLILISIIILCLLLITVFF
jgi:transposase